MRNDNKNILREMNSRNSYVANQVTEFVSFIETELNETQLFKNYFIFYYKLHVSFFTLTS